MYVYVCVSRSSASCSKATAIRWPSLYLILVVYSEEISWLWNRLFTVSKVLLYHLLPRTHINTHKLVWFWRFFACLLYYKQQSRWFRSRNISASNLNIKNILYWERKWYIFEWKRELRKWLFSLKGIQKTNEAYFRIAYGKRIYEWWIRLTCLPWYDVGTKGCNWFLVSKIIWAFLVPFKHILVMKNIL